MSGVWLTESMKDEQLASSECCRETATAWIEPGKGRGHPTGRRCQPLPVGAASADAPPQPSSVRRLDASAFPVATTALGFPVNSRVCASAH